MTAHLDGVLITPLVTIGDERGPVMRMLRVDDSQFAGFGEIYFSAVRSGAVKAWRRHRRATSQLAVPVGSIHLALFDDRPGSATSGRLLAFETGAENYQLITVPPGIWAGWKGLGPGVSLVANCSSLAHDPAESDRLDEATPHIPFDWSAC